MNAKRRLIGLSFLTTKINSKIYAAFFLVLYSEQANTIIMFICTLSFHQIFGQTLYSNYRYAFFYLPYLSSFHEKANCIAMFWTVCPHSLGSCYFQGVWATCLSYKGGGIPLSALPKDTTRKLSGLFSTTSLKCRALSREAADTIFKVFWYDATRGLNSRSTDCEADALTTTPSHQLGQ